MAFDPSNSLQLLVPNTVSQNFKKAWNIDAALMTLGALGLIEEHVSDSTPSTEYHVWLDPAVDPAAAPGTVKLYNGSTWVAATSALFVRYLIRIALRDGLIVESGGDVLTAADIGVDVQAYDADILKKNETATLTAGYNATEYDAGTKSGAATFTPDPANGNFQKCNDNGAFTLAPPGSTCSISLHVTMGASAGAITVSGFTKVTGDALTTTSGHKFIFYITRNNSQSHLHRVAMQ